MSEANDNKVNEEAVADAEGEMKENLSAQAETISTQGPESKPEEVNLTCTGWVQGFLTQSASEQNSTEPIPVGETVTEQPKVEKRYGRKLCLILLAFFVAFGGVFGYLRFLKPALDYRKADRLMDKEDYDGAIALYQDMVDYKDSADKLTKCLELQAKQNQLISKEKQLQESYDKAIKKMADSEYATAINLLLKLGEYSDSVEKVEECRQLLYQDALNAVTKADYDNAILWFEGLGDYKDALNQYNEARYQKAVECLEQELYEEAGILFTQLATLNYKDSEEMQKEAEYLLVMKYIEAEDWSSACAYMSWMDVEGYKNLSELYEQAKINEAFSNMESRDNYCVYNVYLSVKHQGEFDATPKVEKELDARAGEIVKEILKNGSLADVPVAYLLFDFDMSFIPKEDRYQLGISLIQECTEEDGWGNPCLIEAQNLFRGLGNYKEAKKYYEYIKGIWLWDEYDYSCIGASRFNEFVDIQKADEAVQTFQALGNFLNSEEWLWKVTFHEAYYYREYGSYLDSYDKAISLFEKLPLEYRDNDDGLTAEEEVKETKYEKAMYLVDKGRYDDALAILYEIRDYSNMEERISQVQFIKAQSLADSGKYDAAIKCLETIEQTENFRNISELIDYYGKLRDGAAVTDADNPYKISYHNEIATIVSANPGDIVSYGFYFGETEWILMEKQDGKALLLMKNTMTDRVSRDFCYPYDWEDSVARKYLNGAFLYAAFTKEEKAGILETELKNIIYSSQTQLENTIDGVFLLSVDEINRHKDNNIAFSCGNEYCLWMTRDGDGAENDFAPDFNGVTSDYYLRPAMWVDISGQ